MAHGFGRKSDDYEADDDGVEVAEKAYDEAIQVVIRAAQGKL